MSSAFHRENGCPDVRWNGQDRADRRAAFTFLRSARNAMAMGRSAGPARECGGVGRVVTDGESGHRDSSGSKHCFQRVAIPGRRRCRVVWRAGRRSLCDHQCCAASFFRRVGEHFQCTLPISFSEAALGAKIDVPTVDGSAVVRIPPGTQNGQVLQDARKRSAIAASAGYAWGSVG